MGGTCYVFILYYCAEEEEEEEEEASTAHGYFDVLLARVETMFNEHPFLHFVE